MRGLTMRMQLLALVAVAAAVLLVGSLGETRLAHADDIVTPQGVFCFELTAPAVGIGLVRIDDIGSGNITFSSHVYIQTGDAVPSCQSPQDPVPADAESFPAAGAARSVLSGSFNQTGDLLTALVCQPDLTFAGLDLAFAEVEVSFALAKPPDKTTGTFTLRGPFTDDTCGTHDTGFIDVDVNVVGAKFLDGPDVLPPGGDDADPSTFTSDWDKDGITDWAELDPKLLSCADPFKAGGCGVGGVAEQPDVATTPLEAADSSSNTGLIAAIAAAAAVAVAAVGGVAMFARRRQE